MGRHRALLIGASDYDASGVSPLPFVPDDLARLGSVLEDRGFDEVQVLAARDGGKQISANFVNARVIGFLRRAHPGDTLLILLSGHGVHAGGRDYLVPEDIDEDTHPFESGCVAIDWRRHLDETPAGHVVFLIDACREGIEQGAMGVAGVRQWSRQKISAALRRKVAYVYACSPAQLALFVRPQESPADPAPGVVPGESFSIFSRSVSDVVASQPATTALPLDAFAAAVQERVTELHRAYGKKGQPQTLRTIGDIPSDTFLLLPPSKTLKPPAAPLAEATTGADADTAAGSGLGARRHGWLALSALALLALLAATTWVLASFGDHDKGDGDRASKAAGAGGSPTPSVSASGPDSPSPTSKSSKPSGSGEPSKSNKPSGSRTARGSSGSSNAGQADTDGRPTLPDCTESGVAFKVRSVRNSYAPSEIPAFELSATNASGSDCKLDLGPQKTVLTVTQAGADEPLWSSAHCPAGSGSSVVLVPAGDRVTRTVEWDRAPSSPGCGSPEGGSASTGTYLVEAQAPRLTTARTSFVLETD
ncbi:caspase family protein [Streptomyces sp. NPDC041068]|uniref:caspase family protein n=1 Tax=Streptomyces sp. NPDC041068 TaxID=3155130 RepID=UPI0033C2480C